MVQLAVYDAVQTRDNSRASLMCKRRLSMPAFTKAFTSDSQMKRPANKVGKWLNGYTATFWDPLASEHSVRRVALPAAAFDGRCFFYLAIRIWLAITTGWTPWPCKFFLRLLEVLPALLAFISEVRIMRTHTPHKIFGFIYSTQYRSRFGRRKRASPD
jgi:hypothetical protein